VQLWKVLLVANLGPNPNPYTQRMSITDINKAFQDLRKIEDLIKNLRSLLQTGEGKTFIVASLPENFDGWASQVRFARCIHYVYSGNLYVTLSTDFYFSPNNTNSVNILGKVKVHKIIQ